MWFFFFFFGVGYYQGFPCPKWKLVSKEKEFRAGETPQSKNLNKLAPHELRDHHHP